MRIDFACGHHAQTDDDVTNPECPTCHEKRITHVKVRPPRFFGTCCGPCATFDPSVTAVAVNLAPGGPLRLKDRHHGN